MELGKKNNPVLKTDFKYWTEQFKYKKVFVNQQSKEELFSSAEDLYYIFKMLNFDFFTSLLIPFSRWLRNVPNKRDPSGTQ